MMIKYVCDGSPERIPEIGTELDLPVEVTGLSASVKFEVTGYGQTHDESPVCKATGIRYHGKLGYEIELEGNIVVPKGSPMEVLDELLWGKV